MMMPAPLERENILYCTLAIQTRFAASDDVAAAMQCVLPENPRRVGEVLVERGKLTLEQHQQLVELVTQHLQKFGGDPIRDLGAESASRTRVVENLPAYKSPETVSITPARASELASENLKELPRITSSGERFRKLRAHAAGGLGEISLAHDEQLNRVVALKEMQAQFANDPDKMGRFLLEAEVTGSLEHPGIVPVYAMGQNEAGAPFYAMRFIRGESLREAIRRFHGDEQEGNSFGRGSQAFRQLLGQFIDMCNAIAFAHDRGVLHRDIKPENVMVGSFGETLVVDWGMAHVAGRPTIGENTTSIVRPAPRKHGSATQEGSALGTPAYMSPEVAAGKLDRLGPASDVFSLGASLYCLLTNQPPFHARSIFELLQKVECCDYPPPSTLKPQIPKALEAICCRAMSLEPNSRFATPLEFAGDIERWLGDEPVSSYREPLPERIFRWARRHRSPVFALAASTCVITLVSLIAAGLINQSRRQAVALASENAELAIRAATARDEAVRRYAESRQTVDRWLTGFTDAIERYPGVESFRDQMLAQAAERYSQFASEASGDADLALERGRTLIRLGDVRRKLLREEEAKQAYTAAGEVFDKLLANDAHAAEAEFEAANVKLRQGMLANDVGQYTSASELYEKAVSDLEPLVSHDRVNELAKSNLAAARTAYGSVLSVLGKSKEAELQLQQAVKDQLTQVRAAPTNLALLGPLADTRIQLGQVLLSRGANQPAFEEFSQAVEQWRKLTELQLDDPEPRQSLASARINLASALRLLGKYTAEGDAYRMAIADYELLVKAKADDLVYRENLALTQTDYGQLLFEIGQPKQAIDMLTAAKGDLSGMAVVHPEVFRFQEEAAVCLDNLGQAQTDLGLFPQALESLAAAKEMLSKLVREWPDIAAYQERFAICLSHIGQVQAAMGKSKEAIESLETAIRQLNTLHASHSDIASALSALATVHGRLGDVLLDQDQSKKAHDAYAEAARTWQDTLALSPSAEYLHRAAWFLTMCPSDQAPDNTTALDYAGRAVEQAPENGFYLGTLAAAQVRAGHFLEAISLLDRAQKMDGYDRGRDALFRAYCNAQLGHKDQARLDLELAVKWIAENRPGNGQLKRLLSEVSRTIESPQTDSVQAPPPASK